MELHDRLDGRRIGIVVLAVGGEDIVIGDEELEESLGDVPDAAVVRHLQQVDLGGRAPSPSSFQALTTSSPWHRRSAAACARRPPPARRSTTGSGSTCPALFRAGTAPAGGLAGLLGRLLERLRPLLAQRFDPVLQRTDDRHLGALDGEFLLPFLAITKPLTGILPFSRKRREVGGQRIALGDALHDQRGVLVVDAGRFSSLTSDCSEAVAASASPDKPAGFGPTSLSNELNQKRANFTARAALGARYVSAFVSFWMPLM